MIKIFLLSLMLALISSFSVCQALSPERMTAGGIYILQRKADVIAIYGQPVKITKNKIVAGHPHTDYIYEYGRHGTTFSICLRNDFEVSHIHVAGNNGIATKDGIKVGTPVSAVKSILGKPDVESKDTLWYYEPNKGMPMSMQIIVKNNVVESYRIHDRID
ncbi:MAG: hypothetical protein IJR22_06060 [Acidaminococcaceae bacterium]|nr:hypothetical protein [Acidaminococcaceae bacterium]